MAETQGNASPPINESSNISYGAVGPYTLPLSVPDEAFDPISWFVTEESGESGPMNAECLRNFLKGRKRSVIPVIEKYTDDILGFYNQLRNLRFRIMQIQITENDLSQYIKIRIKAMGADVIKGRKSPAIQHELPLSSAVERALQYIGNQGPLDENQLLDFIHTGTYNELIQKDDMKKQLDDFLKRIIVEMGRKNRKLTLCSRRITKTIREIIKVRMIAEPDFSIL